MNATIWHNPKCGTSRKTLTILENLSQVELMVIEYLKEPPSAAKLAQLYKDAGISPQVPMPRNAACPKLRTTRCWPRWWPTRSS